MTITIFIQWMTAIFYIMAFLLFVFVLPIVFIKKKFDLRRLESCIKEKIDKGINLEPNDIFALGKALDFGPINSRKPIYSLLLNYNEKDKFDQVNSIRIKIEKEEPFSDMPDEVKMPLTRISFLAENSETESDKYLLLPIHKILAKYVELESERDKFRSRAKWSIIVTIITTLMGAYSFYLSLKSPTIEQIRKTFQEETAISQRKGNP